LLTTGLLFVPASLAVAQTPPARPALRAVRVARPPVIDGRLSEEEWTQAPSASGFTQRDPDEGAPATADTEIRITYDDTALYVGARLLDPEPGQVSLRLSPRDASFDADWFGIYLDPMRDRLTGAVFRVSAANVQQDQLISNDTRTDSSWDAVWQSAVAMSSDGWTAELRIPLSQLRFTNDERQVWGINVERYVRRRNESSFLQMVPRDESGLASRMVDLEGLDGLRPRRRFEWLPYAATRAEFIAPLRAGDPFNDGSRVSVAGGLDAKVGLTTNLTLNATVNPDFGQVEVDPAVINLTAFETFFDERRPFFIEGSQILSNFGLSGSNNYWGFNLADPTIFYSRRIGRFPQVGATGDYIDAPSATTIMGAVKLTGKTSGGWSVGLLEAVTGREHARIQTASLRGAIESEPLTSYTVARVHREIGRFGTGALATAVNRSLSTTRLRDALTESAYTFGADGHVFLGQGRDWVITGKIAGSYVAGTPDVVARLQRASQRYYQRPDAPHVSFDPGRSSLRGYTSRLLLNRNSGRWQVNAQIFGTSPGFEANDLGFHGSTDRAGAHGVFMWREDDPKGIIRSWNAWAAKWWTWNYAREPLGDGLNTDLFLTFLNYWTLSGNFGVRGEVTDDRFTRGGPSAITPGGGYWGIRGGTDSRAWFSVQPNYSYSWNRAGGWTSSLNLPISLKPASRLTISTGPNWTKTRSVAQYLTALADPSASATYGNRYVFGELDQSQLTLTTRASLTLSPALSVQIFAQPLLAAGDFTSFKEFAAPRTFDFLGDTSDPGAFGLSNPDFNLKSLRLNAVLRWETRPGSTFYAVWTRTQENRFTSGSFSPGRDAKALLTTPGDDVVMIKMAYWIGR
jgi:hypothetical protein